MRNESKMRITCSVAADRTASARSTTSLLLPELGFKMKSSHRHHEIANSRADSAGGALGELGESRDSVEMSASVTRSRSALGAVSANSGKSILQSAERSQFVQVQLVQARAPVYPMACVARSLRIARFILPEECQNEACVERSHGRFGADIACRRPQLRRARGVVKHQPLQRAIEACHSELAERNVTLGDASAQLLQIPSEFDTAR